MQLVPWIFGIPHPTGFPAYVLLAGAFAHLFAIGTVAWRASFFCGMLMLGAAAAVYAAIARASGDRLTAAAAAWLLAFGAYFWIYGNRAEIHAMAAFWAALALCFALRGYYGREVRAFGGAALALGMGLATHPIVVFILPGLLVLAAARARLFTVRSASIPAVLMLAPLLLYAYLPIRSHMVVAAGLDPAVALGKPPGGALWNTENPQTLSGFVRLVSGADFHAAGSVLRMADLPAYAGKIGLFARAMYREFTPIGAVAAFVSLGILIRRRAAVAAALLLCVLLPAAFAIDYPPVVEIGRYFFIPFVATALLVGLGIAELPERYRNLLRIPVAIAAVVLLAVNYPLARFQSTAGSERLIAYVRNATAPNAIVLADWTRGTALAYALYVDRTMGNRRLDIAWPFQDLRYLPGWLKEHRVYYVGRLFTQTHHRVLLCRLSGEFPVYAVRLQPGHC